MNGSLVASETEALEVFRSAAYLKPANGFAAEKERAIANLYVDAANIGVSGNRIQQEAQKANETPLQRLSDPTNWTNLKSSQTTARMSLWNRAWLLWFQKQGGFRSLNETLTYCIENSRRENTALPVRKELVFHGDSPVSIVGLSGSGKTTSVKRFIIPFSPGPLACLDVAGEYSELKKLTLPDLIGLKWARADKSTRIRFVPNPNPHLSKTELDLLFTHLNVTKLEGFEPGTFPSGKLKAWTFVLEEAHRLRDIESGLNFVLEARKFCRKVIVVSSDKELFSSVCRLLMPEVERTGT